MENTNIFAPVVDMVIVVVVGIMGGISSVPWVQVATFLTLCLNGLYVAYKWRKSIQYNKIGLKSAQADLDLKEEQLRQLRNKNQ